MISYEIAKQKDLNKIMKVISDVEISKQKGSKKIIVERIEQSQLLHVVANNKIIGFIGWNKNFQNNPDNWYLEQITVHKDYRGRGIGKDFVLYFLNFCRKNRVKKIYANVQEHNERSLKMFMDTGWMICTHPDKKISKETAIEFSFK